MKSPTVRIESSIGFELCYRRWGGSWRRDTSRSLENRPLDIVLPQRKFVNLLGHMQRLSTMPAKPERPWCKL